jgi:hypothetical protein
LSNLPADPQRRAQRISQDDLAINFPHRGLEERDDAVNKASSRLTLAIIVGSLIVGSSMILHPGHQTADPGIPGAGHHRLSALGVDRVMGDLGHRPLRPAEVSAVRACG